MGCYCRNAYFEAQLDFFCDCVAASREADGDFIVRFLSFLFETRSLLACSILNRGQFGQDHAEYLDGGLVASIPIPIERREAVEEERKPTTAAERAKARADARRRKQEADQE